ncbi:MAG TPA: serine O-acetyltransferase EpsC [Acidimicrobiales bacterium]|nr:serine O-acetyltransferase EpsC [Acidimicrobiales bacterium]
MFDALKVAYRKDPALHGVHAFEVILYQGIWAIWSYRLAHALQKIHLPFFPRLISQLARLFTGIEIHPGAVIGKRCFIDHGAGVVIGETAVLGDDVMLYQGVTLGGHGWWTDAKGAKRHPTIGNNVTLGVGCSVLGPVVVGEDSRIGPHALVVDDVPARSIVVVERGHCVTLSRARFKEPEDEERLPATWMTGEGEERPDGTA